jgi:hypothetical protein
LKNEVAAVVLVLAIIVSAGAGYLAGIANQHPTTYSIVTLSQVSAGTYFNNGRFLLSIPLLSSTPCSKGVKSEPLGFTFYVSSNSPALLCVAFFYYNTSAPLKLVPADQLTIYGLPLNSAGTYTTFDAKPNFTVTSQPPSIELGGKTNESEGTEVTYYIQANKGVNGTFDMSLATLLPMGIGCAGEFLLVAGSGVPQYAFPGSCFIVPVGSGVSSPLTPGYLFVTVIGATNSTR